MRIMDLNPGWHIKRIEPDAEIADLLAEGFAPEGWLMADMPEQIHATLRKAALITGPYYGKDFAEDAWVAQSGWVYCKAFYVEPGTAGRALLEFDGLDTFCDVYLNGAMLGSGSNMHLPLAFDVSDLLRTGARNVLLVRFAPAVAAVADRSRRGLFPLNKVERVLARKAQMSYGWDFCAPTLGVGVWRPVRLRFVDGPRLVDYHLRTLALVESGARMQLDVAVEGGEQGLTLQAELLDGEAPAWRWQGEARTVAFDLAGPKLWWPSAYGEPHLYDFRLRLMRGDECLDALNGRVGVRTIELDDSPTQDGGRLFAVRVNGRRLFIRGANWVPMSAVFTDVTPEMYRRALRRALDANLTMLRIWGGGFYEPDAFYDACDELGILVWSDFMFACGVYPSDEAFLESVRAEAVHAVRAARNHASLALWSGDNEVDQSYGWDGRDHQFLKNPISRGVLSEVCAALDPSRYYLPSSPCSPDTGILGGDNPNSPFQGDVHLYQMSARREAQDYYPKVLAFAPRFMSEFGFVSLPWMESFDRFNVRGLALSGERWLKQALPNYDWAMERRGLPGISWLSQILHALGLKLGIEHMRALKGTCYGTLYWKFNDPLAGTGSDPRGQGPWPSLMAALDMFGRPKLAYHVTRRAYADELVCAIPYENGVRIFAVTERDRPIEGTLRIRALSFAGDELLRIERPVSAAGDASSELVCLPWAELPTDRYRDAYLKIELGALENRLYFAEVAQWHELDDTPCGLRVLSARWEGAALLLRLSAGRLARFVHIHAPEADLWLDDNDFDIDPGQTREVRLRLDDCKDMLSTLLLIDCENAPRIALPLASVEKTNP